MLTLVVTSLEDRPLDFPMHADFDAHGGTIGRLGTNTLVLPDLEGRVAPLQARIQWSARGSYVIRNCGPSPLQLNGALVARDDEAALAQGDEIRIGAYEMRVTRADSEHVANESGAATSAPLSAVSPREAASPRADAHASEEGVTHDPLTRAFLDGLEMPDLVLPGGLDPALMERIGALLRQVTEGTIDLLRVRSEAKSSVHAGATMIDSRAINPFKAAWDADVALRQLLAPRRSDILGPLAAMTDAYHDLRVHDRGLVAGIHAALAGLLERFKPGELEKRLAAAGTLEHLLPGGGKARRWDLLVELYGELSAEAQQDFWSVFEKEFLEAYAAGRRSSGDTGVDHRDTPH